MFLFDSYIGPYQVLSPRTKWIWDRWQWRGTPHSPKLQHYLSLMIRFVNLIFSLLVAREKSYPSVEMLSVYFKEPADSAFLGPSKTDLIENFNFPRLVAITNYLPIAEKRILWFILFPKIFALSEMKTTSVRIWTRVAKSIFYNDNQNATSASICNIVDRIYLLKGEEDQKGLNSQYNHYLQNQGLHLGIHPKYILSAMVMCKVNV